jgi:hypothetical protein
MARRLIVARTPVSGIGQPDTAGGTRGRDAVTGETEYWDRLRFELMDALAGALEGGSLTGVHVFQEGLSAAGEDALEMAAEMASRGNPSYKLVLELIGRGARLQQTEDADLLQQSHDLLRDALMAPLLNDRIEARRLYQARQDELTAQRSSYIAGRVDRVVGPDETAVLMIGPAYRVEDLMPADFHVTVLAGAPPDCR